MGGVGSGRRPKSEAVVSIGELDKLDSHRKLSWELLDITAARLRKALRSGTLKDSQLPVTFGILWDKAHTQPAQPKQTNNLCIQIDARGEKGDLVERLAERVAALSGSEQSIKSAHQSPEKPKQTELSAFEVEVTPVPPPKDKKASVSEQRSVDNE